MSKKYSGKKLSSRILATLREEDLNTQRCHSAITHRDQILLNASSPEEDKLVDLSETGVYIPAQENSNEGMNYFY